LRDLQVLPEAVSKLLTSLTKLPGIGPKSAQRIAFYLVKAPREEIQFFYQALKEVGEKIKHCSICGFYAEGEVCKICQDASRDRSTICVVEKPQDVIALERTSYRGLYHVLQGSLSPLSGKTPQDLSIEELLQRIQKGNIKEVILATSPSVDGEVTALFIARKLRAFPIKISIVARGLPLGGDLELADELTLAQALEGRKELHVD
jgi:recombination protein RecR